FLGLFVGPKERFNMGVNEKGLVVFRTTAGSVPKHIRRQSVRFKSKEGLSGHEYLIRNCATVDEALAQTEVFSHEPTNYMLADARKIAVVEVMPGGRRAVTVRDRGTLAHTNHYLAEEALADNIKIGKSSRTRYERIEELLKASPRPLTMDDFAAFARDRNDGPNNSIFRIGPEAKITTLSSMVVYLPENGVPVAEFAWRPDPAEPERWLRQHLIFPTAR
ncbi:MAG: carcinine hydrolase/isopenicillin-N N-acyltransferase family protein, partial [Duodenibacillus sp.]